MPSPQAPAPRRRPSPSRSALAVALLGQLLLLLAAPAARAASAPPEPPAAAQAPAINPFAFNQNVQENQRASVMCTTSSGETPIQFVWLKDGQLLSSQLAQARRLDIKHDQDASTLKIRAVKLDHAGNYTCLAKNRLGQQAHSAQLVVHGEPRWLREPQSEPLVATRGQLVVIDCQTTGWPRPQQSWLIKTPQQSDFEPLQPAGGRVSLAANGSLVIRNADKADEANYRCKSTNGIGRGLIWNTSLRVTVPAHFETPKQQTIVVRKQAQVELRCDAFGDQPIAVEWLRNKQSLAQEPPEPRYSIHSSNNTLKNGLISKLLIKQPQRQDNALFECLIRNPFGRDRAHIELVVEEEPDNIQELQVTQVNSRSVTLMWSEPYDGRAPITGYMFQYKRTHEAAPVAELDFMELAGAELAGPERKSTGQPSGSVLLDADWQQASRIMLPVGGPPGAPANWSGPGGPAGLKSITIERLEPSSRYLLRALAINAVGQSKFSQPMEFATDEEAPEIGPINIRAAPINSTSIQVSWDEIPKSKHLGRIHGYYIGYRVASNNSAAANFVYKPYIINDLVAQQHPQLAGAGAHQAEPGPGPGARPQRLETVIHELRRDTTYEITVVAFNSRGSGPASDFVVCRTIEMEAPKPVKLQIRRESNESIFIEWQRDPSDQNPVDDYVLYQEKNSAAQEWLQVRLPGNQTQYVSPGLKCGTRYQFYIVAQNKVGKSAASEVVGASTSGALPAIPAKTSLIKQLNATCLLINLNSFQDNGCRIKTFTVRYRVDRVAAAGPGAGLAAAGAPGALGAPGQLLNSQGLGASHQALVAGGAGQLAGAGAAKASAAGPAGPLDAPASPEWVNIRPKSSLKHQRPNEEDRMEYLCDLSATGEYTLHVAASNDVGRSEVEYAVAMASDELRHSALRDLLELLAGLPSVFAYVPSMLVFLLAGLLLSLVSLILYTTAIKYYQKFVIMQNQMRAGRRAKADERRRRKLANSQAARQQKLELWADEYEQAEGSSNQLDDDDDDDDDPDRATNTDDDELEAGSGRPIMLERDLHDGDDELEDPDTSSAGSTRNSRRAHPRARPHQAGRGQAHLSRAPAGSLHARQFSHRSAAGHYLANLAGSAFDSSSIDSGRCAKFAAGSSCLSSASTESVRGGRFQCLNAKQYVKMNEYTMLPPSAAAAGPSPASLANEIYGIVPVAAPAGPPAPPAAPAPAGLHFRSSASNSPSNSSTSNPNNNINNNNNNPSLYYSTLRRSNMQTYLPPQRQPQHQQQQQQHQLINRRHSQNVADIYGYYMAPGRAQAAAVAAAAHQAANEAANSIFVPPQQIIYSAPNIRRQPPMFL